MYPGARQSPLTTALLPERLAPRGKGSQPGVQPMGGPTDRRQQRVLERRVGEHAVLILGVCLHELIDRRRDDLEQAAGPGPVRQLEIPPFVQLSSGPPD